MDFSGLFGTERLTENYTRIEIESIINYTRTGSIIKLNVTFTELDNRGKIAEFADSFWFTPNSTKLCCGLSTE